MPVSSTHPDYDKMVPKWNLVRSIVDNDAKKWIRTVDASDPNRSAQYRDDAVLTNFTRLTKIGLTGLIFRKPAKCDLPAALEYLKDDATGYGFGLEQFTSQIAGEVLMTGRHGLLIDYPDIDEDVSEDVARFRPYTAENIINWKYREVGSRYVLSLLVLKECVDVVGDDGFEWLTVEQYRVLRLNKEGIYQQELYNEDLELVSGYIPTDYNQNPFYEIPFVFVGSENNDDHMDTIPLYDMSVVNLAHYRNSADLEESIFINGQPYPVINVGDGVSAEEFKQVNPDGVKFGSRKGLILGGGGNATLLQANANQMVSVEMKRKEEQAAAIGARLIAPPGGRETAEAARIRYGSQSSALYTITKNIDRAIEYGLWIIARFMMETPEESEFALNDQFYEESADPNLIASQIMLLDRGTMTTEEVRENLKRTGIQLDDIYVEPEIDPLQGVADNEPE